LTNTGKPVKWKYGLWRERSKRMKGRNGILVFLAIMMVLSAALLSACGKSGAAAFGGKYSLYKMESGATVIDENQLKQAGYSDSYLEFKDGEVTGQVGPSNFGPSKFKKESDEVTIVREISEEESLQEYSITVTGDELILEIEGNKLYFKKA
jgi:hypothetical protein